tara:strand:- start:777 stop:1055 length:279 start_codon:yes stop_codon:yes gene_type:complete
MIKFYGYELENNNIDKDQIKIKIIDKRPGEKLYEELLINNSSKKTNYPKVMIDNVENQFIDDLDGKMMFADSLIKDREYDEIINIINKLSKD